MILPVLLGAVILMIASYALLSLSWNSRMQTIRHSQGIAARVAADAALARAIHTVDSQVQSGTFNDQALPQQARTSLPNSNAEYAYSLGIPVGSSGDTYEIVATGYSGSVVKTVKSLIGLEGGKFEYALFAKGDIEIANDASVSGYNLPPAAGGKIKIGSNGTREKTVLIHNSAVVNGDVLVGPGANTNKAIKAKNDGKIKGSKGTLSKKQEIPSVTVPPGLASAPSNGEIKNGKTISTSGKYKSIKVGNDGKLKIIGDVSLYITGDIDFSNSSTLEIGGSSSLTLYVGGSFDAGNSASLNTKGKDASALTINALPSCGKVKIHNDARFYGAIYAPDTKVELDNSGDIYGAVVGSEIKLHNSAYMHYDGSLTGSGGASGGSAVKVQRWYE